MFGLVNLHTVFFHDLDKKIRFGITVVYLSSARGSSIARPAVMHQATCCNSTPPSRTATPVLPARVSRGGRCCPHETVIVEGAT